MMVTNRARIFIKKFRLQVPHRKLFKTMKKYQVQSVGIGLIDCICPTNNIASFINEVYKNNYQISAYSLWEYVSNDKKQSKVGMGGPLNKFGTGWYAEIPCDILDFVSIEEMKQYIQQESKKWNCEIVPGFWITTKK